MNISAPVDGAVRKFTGLLHLTPTGYIITEALYQINQNNKYLDKDA